MTDHTSLDEQINQWFKYHTPTDDQRVQLQVVREAAKNFAWVLDESVPASADKTAALRKLRECVMTANAAIVLEGK